MDELKIQLNYNPDFFREIYYKNGQGNVFTAEGTKKAIHISMALIAATLALYFISLNNPRISWLLVLGSIIIASSLIYTAILILKHKRWKNNLEKYLDKISSYHSYSVNLTERSIEVAFDSSITIDKWEVFRMAEIEPDYVSLTKQGEGITYFFPARSMNENEFKTLTGFIREKLKH